jgi:hypothetical protein
MMLLRFSLHPLRNGDNSRSRRARKNTKTTEQLISRGGADAAENAEKTDLAERRRMWTSRFVVSALVG